MTTTIHLIRRRHGEPDQNLATFHDVPLVTDFYAMRGIIAGDIEATNAISIRILRGHLLKAVQPITAARESEKLRDAYQSVKHAIEQIDKKDRVYVQVIGEQQTRSGLQDLAEPLSRF